MSSGIPFLFDGLKMKIIQITHGYDTVIVTASINQALSVCEHYIKKFSNENVVELVEVDVWEDGYFIEGSGFVCVPNEITNIENFLNGI